MSGTSLGPVLVETRNAVIDVCQLVTVAEVSTHVRGTHAEVSFGWEDAGLSQVSVVNVDVLHTIRRSALRNKVGALTASELEKVCAALTHALGC